MANYAISYGRNCHTAADAPCGRPRRARLRHKPASADGDHVNSLARGGAALVAFAVVAVLVALGALARVDRAVLDIVQLPHASWLDLGASLVTALGQSE